ncbi:MAG: 1-acyl-sn-glycerol-3-phosphate acyltransferase [Clostridia bacterium]|nr:1-acyl-sn-glycerol-3-phosphate acyltransferase [Clostridia bacterium]
MIDDEGRVWPDDPAAHIMTPPKKRRKISDDYKYRHRNPFYKVYSRILRTIALIFLPIGNFWRYHFRIKGLKNLKQIKRTGAIVVANHVLNMDAAIISSSIFKYRKLNFIILGENATIPVAGKIITALGGIPIADDIKGTKKFMTYCNWLLRKKKPILVFPEKSLWHGYKGIRPFDKGAFSLAVNNEVPVLPIVITLKTRNKNKKRPKYTAYFHIKPVVCGDETLAKPKQAEELRDRTQQLFIDTSKEFYDKLKAKRDKKAKNKKQPT